MAKITQANGATYDAAEIEGNPDLAPQPGSEESAECPGDNSYRSLPKREPKRDGETSESGKLAPRTGSPTGSGQTDGSTARSTGTGQTKRSK